METIIVSMKATAERASEVAGLEVHLGYLLRRVSNAVSGAFAHALQKEETSVAEWVLLRELHKRGKSPPGELADTLGLTRGAVSKIVDKLEAKRWVKTEAHKGDSRSCLLFLTRAGERKLPVLAGLADQNEERFFKCLSARERKLLRGLLVELAKNNDIHDVPTD